MPKAKTNERPNEGSLARTARLARKLLAVPKREVDKQHEKYERGKRERSSE